MAAGVTGQTIGGLAGGLVGSQTSLGSAQGVQLGAGIGGLIGSRSDRKAADQATPGLVDPLEQARLAELDQIRKSISTGSDVVTQTNIDQLRNIGGTAQQNIVRATGGDVGGTVSALLKAQNVTGGGINQALAQGQERLPFFENLFQQMSTRTSQRKLELGLLNRAQLLAESAQSGKDATQNLLSFAATEGSLPGAGGGSPKDILGGDKGGGQVQKGAEAPTDAASSGLLKSLGGQAAGGGAAGGLAPTLGAEGLAAGAGGAGLGVAGGAGAAAAAPATGGASLLLPLLLSQ